MATMNSCKAAFTPNGDGLNDVFRIGNLKYSKLEEFRIFNRWGQCVFYTTDPKQGWDGKFNNIPQDMETYQYLVVISHPDHTHRVMKGNVTLVR